MKLIKMIIILNFKNKKTIINHNNKYNQNKNNMYQKIGNLFNKQVKLTFNFNKSFNNHHRKIKQ